MILGYGFHGREDAKENDSFYQSNCVDIQRLKSFHLY